MSEHEPEVGPVVKVARDLTEILRLHDDLLTQAVHKANDGLMPGGEAMVALGSVANLEAWENLTAASEALGRAYTSAEDEDPDEAWSAFQRIEFWSEAWRRERGEEYDMRPTIVSEASYLRQLLHWAWDYEQNWDAFARDINRARVTLENILAAGERQERTRVPCARPDCERHPMLIKVYAAGDEHDDRWKCPACKHRYDHDEFQKAYAEQLRSDNAMRYVPLRDAIGLLRGFGRTENAVRDWMRVKMTHEADICPECEASFAPSDRERACPDCGATLEPVERVQDPEDVVEAYCELGSRTRWVWWPDIWTRHLARESRKRSA